MGNELILHCGSERITRNELRFVETPQNTHSWHPVPHADVADFIVNQALDNGFRIEREEYGLNPSQSRMFGVLRFHPEGHPEHSRVLGFRNSHDKSFALGLTVGLRVLVCDNLCFGGEQTILRRHTKMIDIESLIPKAFAELNGRFDKLETQYNRLKDQIVSDDNARLTVVKAAENDLIPSCDVIPILQEYRNPRHDEFREMTQWALYNSFSEIAKKYKPDRSYKCFRGLAVIFDLQDAA